MESVTRHGCSFGFATAAYALIRPSFETTFSLAFWLFWYMVIPAFWSGCGPGRSTLGAPVALDCSAAASRSAAAGQAASCGCPLFSRLFSDGPTYCSLQYNRLLISLPIPKENPFQAPFPSTRNGLLFYNPGNTTRRTCPTAFRGSKLPFPCGKGEIVVY